MHKPLTEYTFSIVDTETTGLSPIKGDKLVEIGVIKIEPELKLNMNNVYNELINPEMEIPYSAYKVHGIDNDMVGNSPTVDKVLPSFNDFIKGTVIVAHNAKFDMKFIQHSMSRCQLNSTELCVLDTLVLAKKVFPELKKYNLDILIEYFGIRVDLNDSYRHRAVFDAAHTAILFQRILEKIMIFQPDMTLDELINY